MADVTLKLSAKDIYEKEFEKSLRGFKTEEVDAFLDDIISDYQKMADLNNEVLKLTEENSKLKKEIEELRLRVASGRPQGSQQYNSNNVDILKRISNLEKAVFGE
ncbi:MULTISPECIES: cell division regulator GpsB [Mammaliicoccus]|uniref:Cell division regulator GpsB n=1 Tax=Mammaliicoccus fleurettii TaxID=150056 RepID=A0ABS5MKC7_9STAP|nr:MULTISPECIES: cell division regulator GpsB [Mammaliicoccus]HCN59741.1 cell division regulator GpsB [Staphylococcus sp.]MBL0846100.1 cell division regulator GpsB [Mammaliicoccus fleurettii]MBO3062537.1 cell division regulator GpsB [Mammaliicoccus fleurettii]MBS3671299.1 cell division regulator GpsB [Mammaliicoccus fleurettii]MBS3696327.1 cell division regulator GpsB [Mammaliicoccus fleurettii]